MATTAGLESGPEYLPARMLNEFVYCPRLFWYEHVEAVFVHNRETVEGAIRHARLDTGSGEIAPATDLAPEDVLHALSVTLSSDSRHHRQDGPHRSGGRVGDASRL